MFPSQFSDISVDDAIAFLRTQGYIIMSADDPSAPIGGCRQVWANDIKHYSGYALGLGIVLVVVNMLRMAGVLNFGFASDTRGGKS